MNKVNISQIDTVFVNGSFPIEFLLFYKYKINTPSIRKALKKLSSSFWPLFGNYVSGSIQSSKYIEDKFFAETFHDEDFNPALDENQIWGKYNLVNPDPMEGLFYLSVLQFNNGTVIIPKMNHLVGDGYSYFYFLSILAANSQSSYRPFKNYLIRHLASPKLNKTVLKDYLFNKTKIEEPLENQDYSIRIEPVSKTFIKQEIQKIKTNYGVSVSSNDILSVMVVKTTFENQKAQFKNQFILSIAMDVRRRVKELGPKYFGNGLMFHSLNLNIAELVKKDTSELAIKIRESVPLVDTKSYLEYLNNLESRIEQSSIHSLKPYDPEKGCLVTNLSRMPLQKLNFGSGPPDITLPLTIAKNSAAILANKDNYLLRLVY